MDFNYNLVLTDEMVVDVEMNEEGQIMRCCRYCSNEVKIHTTHYGDEEEYCDCKHMQCIAMQKEEVSYLKNSVRVAEAKLNYLINK